MESDLAETIEEFAFCAGQVLNPLRIDFAENPVIFFGIDGMHTVARNFPPSLQIRLRGLNNFFLLTPSRGT